MKKIKTTAVRFLYVRMHIGNCIALYDNKKQEIRVDIANETVAAYYLATKVYAVLCIVL